MSKDDTTENVDEVEDGQDAPVEVPDTPEVTEEKEPVVYRGKVVRDEGLRK
jgi:hypothetical protein